MRLQTAVRKRRPLAVAQRGQMLEAVPPAEGVNHEDCPADMPDPGEACC